VALQDERLLARHFRGWQPGELAAGRAPAFAVLEGGVAVSICFSARLSEAAAEAGVETAAAQRGRGLAARVTAAWARKIRDAGRTPLYSTSWANGASLGVARQLGLIAYASRWSVSAAGRTR
jgi:predicted GNAT family acetyltransferase